MLGEVMSLSLEERIMLSPAITGGRTRDKTDVGTPEDACCCVLKSCRCVSIFGINVFFNLAKLCTSGRHRSLVVCSLYPDETGKGMQEY